MFPSEQRTIVNKPNIVILIFFVQFVCLEQHNDNTFKKTCSGKHYNKFSYVTYGVVGLFGASPSLTGLRFLPLGQPPFPFLL